MSFDTLAGFYVYAMDYHTGQGSRLYRIMSRIRATLSDRTIAAIRKGKDDPNGEWEQARCVYRRLKQKGLR